MTDVQIAYRELRAEGRPHFAAMRLLAQRYGLDEHTVARALRKADEIDKREARREAA